MTNEKAQARIYNQHKQIFEGYIGVTICTTFLAVIFFRVKSAILAHPKRVKLKEIFDLVSS
jgi:hypothetical protein